MNFVQKHASAAFLIIWMSQLTACTSQQTYGAGQSWQRNECNKIHDQDERRRCMSSANMYHDDYKRQQESPTKVKP